MTGYRLRGFHTLTLCMRKIVHFTALYKTRHLILWLIFFTIHILIHHANSFFGKKKTLLIPQNNIDQWSPTFTFFDWSRVQKDALFKALNSETVYPANYTLLGSQKHITLNMRLRECPPPPPWDTQGYFVQLASTACGERAWSEQRLKCNSTKKNCGKLIKISITFFFFKNSIIYGHIRE